ncbi:TPA: ABC transporter permease [Vibrio cholerae]
MKSILRVIWNYKFFIISSIKTDYKTRYARSKFGALWAIIQPMAMVIVYAFILSNIMTSKLPGVATQYAYPIYILSGIVVWTLFSEVVGRSLTVFIDNASLIKKMNFPKITLPLIVSGSAMINYIIFLILSYASFVFLDHYPYKYLYWMPILSIILLFLALGIGIFFGLLNVFIRDIGQLVNVALQFWFWLTPIVYMVSVIPSDFRFLLYLNPLTGIVQSFQDVMLYDRAPNIELLIYPSISAMVMVLLAFFLYRRANEEMADVL